MTSGLEMEWPILKGEDKVKENKKRNLSKRKIKQVQKRNRKHVIQ